MEIVTYIENPLKIQLPPFKHATKSISTVVSSLDKRAEIFCSQDISIPDKIIMNACLKNDANNDTFKCYLLFGYQLRLKDWQNIRKIYPNIGLKVKLYRGNQVTQISQHIFGAKSFLKGQRNINDLQRTLIKRQQKSLQSFAHMYTVQIASLDQSQSTRVVYYLPTPSGNANTMPLQSLKCRYFNHKFLQILCEYVSLDNNNTSCYKDMAHHEFQAIVYSGKVSSFQILVKFPDNSTQTGRSQISSKQACEVWESFIQKLAPISMTDKHLLDQVDPLDFTQIKKQIRSLYLEQKRIRKSLAFQKIRIVQEIQSAIQFLNLKQVYPQKLTYSGITSQMLKKIRNQNIENKTSWIKQQNFIIKNLDARVTQLEQTKQKYKIALIEQQKTNNDSIQQIRTEIKFLQASIRYEQAEKVNQKFQQKLHLKNKSSLRQNTQSSKNGQSRPSLIIKKGSDIMKQKQQLQELEKQKILKFEMVRAEFEVEKEFSRRKAQYARAAEDLFNYLTDC